MVGMVVIIFPCLESRQWEHPCMCSFKTPSNRCIDLQEEPKISSATSLQRRKKPIKKSKNTNLYCSRGRGRRQARALRGAALHDWGQGRGGRCCARSAAACPVGPHRLPASSTQRRPAAIRKCWRRSCSLHPADPSLPSPPDPSPHLASSWSGRGAEQHGPQRRSG
jgi:hypothetical protein